MSVGDQPTSGDLQVLVTDDRPEGAQPEVDLGWLRSLVVAVLYRLEIEAPARLDLTLVDADSIAELNREHLQGEGPTDVLSFPLYGDGDGLFEPDPIRLLGDIVICPEVAAANAPSHAGTLTDELALLCVHGVLHILGHDHAEVEQAQRMRSLEAQLLAELHRPLAVGTQLP